MKRVLPNSGVKVGVKTKKSANGNATYLLKWNPNIYKWLDLSERVEEIQRRGFFKTLWNCGNTKRIKINDRVFLLRATVAPRGIIASGIVTKAPHKWRREKMLYVEVRFDVLLNPDRECVLTLEQLQKGNLADGPWTIQGSGKSIPPKTAAALESVWHAFLKTRRQTSVALAEEVLAARSYFEGATKQMSVHVYERNPDARRRCISHYGCSCLVCGFNFKKNFGELGTGFIHVHHLKPLGEIQKEYQVDPIKDLRPVCPNCHAMLHRDAETLSIQKLKQLIKK